MARKIIIQERINEPSDFSFRYVFWANVPAARQAGYADANKISQVKDITGPELTLIKDGAILEKQDTSNYPSGTTISSIQADMIVKFNAYQSQVNALNPGKYYGTSWDGTTWTVVTTT